MMFYDKIVKFTNSLFRLVKEVNKTNNVKKWKGIKNIL